MTISEELLIKRNYKLNPPQQAIIPIIEQSNRNIVIAWPTGTGKTIPAEIAILKCFKAGRPALYLAPLKSLVTEKLNYFIEHEIDGMRITARYGDYDGEDNDLLDYDLCISTYEKADSLLRHKNKFMEKLGLIIIDEAHSIGDQTRGSTLEILLTRLIFRCPTARVIALSAVMANSKDLADWLDAEFNQSTWRAVPLSEGVSYYTGNGIDIMWKDGSRGGINMSNQLGVAVNHPVVELALQTIMEERAQVLVFCISRKETYEYARKLAIALETKLTSEERQRLEILADNMHNRDLAEFTARGVGVHNASLNRQQRMLIEEGFRTRLLKALTCTTTLAQGVNLPARRLIVVNLKRFNPKAKMGEPKFPRIPKFEYCLPAGTKILKSTGALENIENIQIGEFIICYLDEKSQNTQVVANSIRQDSLLEIATNKGTTIKLTANHPVLTIKSLLSKSEQLIFDNLNIATTVKELSINLNLPKMTVYSCLKSLQAKGLIKSINSGRAASMIYNANGQILKTESYIQYEILHDAISKLKPTWIKAGDLAINDKIAYINNFDYVSAIPNDFLDLTTENMWFAGIMVTDGDLRAQKDKRYNSISYRARLHNTNKQILERASKTFSKFGHISKLERIQEGFKDFASIEVASKECIEFLMKLGCPLGKKGDFDLPDYFYSLPKELIKSYLAGIIDGDGHIRQVGYINTIIIACGSYNFALAIHNLFLRLGVQSNIITKKAGKSTINDREFDFKESYQVIIYGKAALQMFKNLTVKEIIETKISDYHNAAIDHLAISDIEWAEIKSIKKNDEIVDVYNLETTAHNFIANNYIVHNSNIAGRAGRFGLDPKGEVILHGMQNYCKHCNARLWNTRLPQQCTRCSGWMWPDDLASDLMNYLHKPNEPIMSQLGDEFAMHSHVLSEVAISQPITAEDLKRFFTQTFGARFQNIATTMDLSMHLNKEQLSLIYEQAGQLHTSLMGNLVSMTYINPLSYALINHNVMQPKPFIIGDWLSIITQCPDFIRSSAQELPFTRVLQLWLDEVDVECRTKNECNTCIHFQTGVGPGDTHLATELAQWICNASNVIASARQKKELAKSLKDLEIRLKYGVKSELVDLCKVPYVGRAIARALYDKGYRDRASLKVNIEDEAVQKASGRFYNRIREGLIKH
jgi:replicative superfamily II helicase/Fe2+ or Zn2+ uptake regulation protein